MFKICYIIRVTKGSSYVIPVLRFYSEKMDYILIFRVLKILVFGNIFFVQRNKVPFIQIETKSLFLIRKR